MNKNNMDIFLKIKKPSEFFWVRRIKNVDISRCCAKCFIGDSDTRLYHATAKGQTPRTVELELIPDDKYVAYYLCGLAKNFHYPDNTHIAFVYAPGETLQVETSQVEVTISNASRIDFEHEGYVPNPMGSYTEQQRVCRNWIFANYILEKMLNKKVGDEPGGQMAFI